MASWKSVLKSLPLSDDEKARAFRALFALGWTDAAINKYIEDASEVGEGVLLRVIRALPLPSPSSNHCRPKTVYILCEKLEDEEIVYEKQKLEFQDEAGFRGFMGAHGGFLRPVKELQDKSPDLPAVISFEQLEEGVTYVRCCCGENTHRRIAALKKYADNEARACEDEFAGSMLNELKVNAFAIDPVLRSDLRRHCEDTPDEQEFDVVILDGNDKAYFGFAKHAGRGICIIDDCIREVNKVAHRREHIERFSSYVEFRGRLLGCCVRVDCIQEKAHDAIMEHCWRNSVGLFYRNGHALKMMTSSSVSGYMQHIGKGFINLARRLSK